MFIERMRLTLVFITLVIFPLTYWMLCRRMERAVPNPPRKEFFVIFGSVAGYLLLCVLLMPSPVGLGVVVPFMICAFVALIGSFYSSLRAYPRSGYHVAAACTSGLLIAFPLVLIVISFFSRHP